MATKAGVSTSHHHPKTTHGQRVKPAINSVRAGDKREFCRGHSATRVVPKGCPVWYSRCIRFLLRSRFTQRMQRVIDMRSISKHIAWLCLLLTFWSVLAFAAHHHSNARESATCTLCAAAHSASPEATSILPDATFIPVSTFRSEPVSARQRLVAFALSVRPPPAV
jgi:hypothetical protein